MIKGIQIGETAYVMTALSIHFRTTSAFFREKDAVLADHSPKPFPHFSRGDRDFNLIDMEKRTVVRFEPNRAVARSEGQDSLDRFQTVVDVLREIVNRFQIQDIFQILLHDIRCVPTKNIRKARDFFCEQFCTEKGMSILDDDMTRDYSTTVERKWLLNNKMQEQKVKRECEVEASGVVLVGPATRDEIADKRWIEFHDAADNNLYKAPNLSPSAGVLANMEMYAQPYEGGSQKFMMVETLDAFYRWAVGQTDSVWKRIVTS